MADNNTKHWYGWVEYDEYNPKGKAVIKQLKFKDKPKDAVLFDDEAAAETWKSGKQAQLDAAGPKSEYEKAREAAQVDVNDNAEEQKALDEATQALQEEQTKAKKGIGGLFGGKKFDKNNPAHIKALKDWFDSEDGNFNDLKTYLQSYAGNASMTSEEMRDFLVDHNFHGTNVDAWVNEHTKDGKFYDKENSVDELNKNNETAQENVQKGTARVQGQRAGAGTLGTGGTPEDQKKDLLEGTNGATKTEHPEEVEEGFNETYNSEAYDKAKSEMEKQKQAAAGENIENKTIGDVGGVTQIDPVENQFASQSTEDKQTQGSSQSQPEPGQDNTEAKDFWKKWRAGALRAYPMLQSIGDAISRNARMTADRAALLTGGQRDTGAYDPIEIQQMTPEQRAQLAFADAEAGNYDTLKQAIMSGEIDIENAAQALNMSPESLQERFNRSERSQEADVTGKEMSNEQVAQQIDQSNEGMINSINQQIAANNEAIRALRNPDESWDNYSKAARAVLDAVSGIQTAGSSYSDVLTAGGGADVKAWVVDINGKVVKSIANTTTGSTDVKALDYLQDALDKGQAAYNSTDKNNEIMAQSLENWNKQLVEDRKYYESLRKPLRKLQGKTSLSYSPKESSTKDTETLVNEENTNAE